LNVQTWLRISLITTLAISDDLTEAINHNLAPGSDVIHSA